MAPSADLDSWLARIRQAFREKVTQTRGVGRACVQVWADVQSGTGVTRTAKKGVVEITSNMAYGLLAHAERVLVLSPGGSVLHTAVIERVHGPWRERLATLTRTSRHAARRVGARFLFPVSASPLA